MPPNSARTGVVVIAATRLLPLLTLLLLALSPAVQAQDYTYTTNNGAIVITKYTGTGGDVTIPDKITGLPVTSLADLSFETSTNLTSVSIPNGVTSIGESTFHGCRWLASVTIGHSVTNIGSYAFADCTNLAGAYFQGNAPSLGSSVFTNAYHATVYYLPGTTGWGTTFGGRPTALWKP